MAASNDLRGWIMSGVSGVACILGAAVVCADLILQPLYRKDFRIVNHNGFLSASLCLSAGVMLFTSLYSMLPTSKSYLSKAGWSPRVAAYFLIGLFIAGVVIIRFVSGLIHQFIPSHVVDCAHSHDPETHSDPEVGPPEPSLEEDEQDTGAIVDGNTERTPLLRPVEPRSFQSTPAVLQQSRMQQPVENVRQKEPLRMRLTRQFTQLVGGVKPMCDENGPCYGFSQTCGGECTKTFDRARPLRRHQSLSFHLSPGWQESRPPNWPPRASRALSEGAHRVGYPDAGSSTHSGYHESRCKSPDTVPAPEDQEQHAAQHHHHVPQNAFMSIGLQTSLAIALHKLPEGFITYATNHASPTLGMTVFLALFIHNISEGFAMAVPLYLALHSRGKAMFWSSLLGGISQPAGAGIAALWIWTSSKANGRDGHGSENNGPSWGVYGGLFAATAGVMTSVALQLFSEGLALTHNRPMGIGFAIAGMGLMGLSFALTA